MNTYCADVENQTIHGAVRRISVMHLIHSMAYGGIETAVINWLRKIDRTKFDVSLVCFANPGETEAPFVNAAIRAGLQAEKIPWHRGKPLVKSSRRLAKLMRDHNVDILHTHNCYADIVGAIASRLKPAKSIATVYVWADYDWKRNMIQALDRVVLRAFDRVTAHCEDTQRKSGKLGRYAGGVDTLICGFEARRVAMTEQERLKRRHEMGVADEEVILGNVARLYPEKAHDSLLRSFKIIALKHPNARLWISGIGPLDSAIRAKCTELGLDDRVNFLGFVEDLPRLMRLMDIQVHPAHVEGVPLALCEGMAAGLPVVASAVGGIPEILNHGASGVLVRPGDEQGFAQAVSDLIDNPQERFKLGSAARHFMENDYSLNHAVSRVEDTYFEMMRR